VRDEAARHEGRTEWAPCVMKPHAVRHVQSGPRA
jgi:hypothetical protein